MTTQTGEEGAAIQSAEILKIIAKEEIKINAPEVKLNAKLQINTTQGGD